MDFLDPKKKKAHIVRLYIGYALMAVLITFGALILLYASYGYGVDRKGNVVQNGLVFLASSPDAAEVKIKNKDGSYEKSVITEERLVLQQDQYNFEFLKEGFRAWKRTVDLRGGDIQRLNYPYLFPVKLEAKTERNYSSKPVFSTVSPAREWLMIQAAGSVSSFDTINLNDQETSSKRVEFPSAVFPGSTSSTKLKLVEWSSDNRHLLVSYKTAGITQFVLLDRESPTDSINLNLKYGRQFKQVRLRDKKHDSFYFRANNNSILTAGFDATSVKKILDNVQAFQPHGNDRILFINSKNQTKTNKVLVQVWIEDEEIYTVRDLPRSDSYVLDIAQYDNNWLVAAGASSGRDEVYVYRNPIENLKRNNEATFSTRTMRINDVKNISFSANTRFLSAQSGQRFVVYDAEEDQQYRFKIGSKLDLPNKADWMDGHRLMAVSAGKVIVFEFDGENFQTLNGGVASLTSTFDSDYKKLFSITKTNKKDAPFVLQSTDMRPAQN